MLDSIRSVGQWSRMIHKNWVVEAIQKLVWKKKSIE